MKRILLIGLGCLPFMPSFADETEGKLGVEEVVSRALAANPMNAPPVSYSDAAPAYGGSYPYRRAALCPCGRRVSACHQTIRTVAARARLPW